MNMEYMTSYFFCSPKLIDPLEEVQEIYKVIRNIPWLPDKATSMSRTGKEIAWQEAYNRLFELEFEKIGGWTLHPVLSESLKHKGDFAKNDVFVEIQFGNSSTIYRDYYKFHYGLMNKLLSLAVLIVPSVPLQFFPSRNPQSITNMASFEYAHAHFTALTIPVPLLLIGLMPQNG